MPTLPDTLKSYRLYIAMFVLNLAVVIGIIALLYREPPRPVVVTAPPARAPTNISKANTRIRVTVSGAVKEPGALELDGGARLADALQKAGLKPEADLSKLNLTLALKDGDKIHVPARATDAALTKDNASAPTNPAPPTSNASNAATPSAQTKLNLNTATLEELDALPGIGPALAQRILDYRSEHGGFKSVEELKEVRGIGDTLFAELKDLVTIGGN